MHTPRQRIHLESATLTVGDALHALRLALGARPERNARGFYEDMWSVMAGGPALAVASGRGALTTALRSSGVGPGDEVVITGFTCVAVPIAVRAAGAAPSYADIDMTTGNMTPETVAASVTNRTKAIIVQHYLGNPAPVQAIRSLLPPKILIIEDAVHALGSASGGIMVGRQGDWVVFGTEQSKPLSTGQGGVLVANTPRAREGLARVKGLATWETSRTRAWLARIALDRLAASAAEHAGSRTGETLHRVLHRAGLRRVSSSDGLESQGISPGWREAYLPDELASIGLRQLSRLEAIIAHRRRITALYDSIFPAESRLAVALDGSPVWLRYPIRVTDGARVYTDLRAQGIEPGGRWFAAPVYPAPAMAAVGYQPGSCPAAEHLASRVVNLPTHPLIDRARAETLAAWMLRHT